ncbi:hypothetical protein L1286_14335 [Pseudoalteromonas sp. SMS1]|uniref:hypothetical protein n=1 Tax=Pseudoalteromonas sp. SMS1 TaxID=2908894 RepID=UPI001F482518|nr:hypothetical protein [Pseudoalteromonas sp. SMS1]MCF2858661.1 hypothetical protein [Pseudoalteromonas sp. SMS1]
MKLQLNKKAMKALSNDNSTLPANMTPQVGGGQVNPAFFRTDPWGSCWSGQNHSCRQHTCEIE